MSKEEKKPVCDMAGMLKRCNMNSEESLRAKARKLGIAPKDGYKWFKEADAAAFAKKIVDGMRGAKKAAPKKAAAKKPASKKPAPKKTVAKDTAAV